MKWCVTFLAAVLSVVSTGAQSPPAVTDISPAVWPKGEYERFIAAQNIHRTKAGVATGRNGAVTVAYNGTALDQIGRGAEEGTRHLAGQRARLSARGPEGPVLSGPRFFASLAHVRAIRARTLEAHPGP